MFVLDKLYQKDPNYPEKGSYIEKYLFYRAQKDDIDADVCEEYVNMYLAHPIIGVHAEVRRQPGTCNKYEITDGRNIYRGETLVNCMQILLQIVNYEKKQERIFSSDIDEIKQGLDYSTILNENPRLREKVEHFVCLCYGEGNFFPIPYEEGYSLNIAKGKLKSQGNNHTLADSSDAYFDVCYNYFNNKQIYCSLVRLIDEKYPVWKKRYCTTGGWETFIQDNHFHDFVSLGVPKKMWDNTENGFVHDLESYLDAVCTALTKREAEVKKAWKKPDRT